MSLRSITLVLILAWAWPIALAGLVLYTIFDLVRR